MEIKVSLPLHIHINGKKIALSLNEYRNLHFQVLSKLKKQASRIVLSQLPNPPAKPFNSADIQVLFFPDNLHKDLRNFAPIASKFADDAMVEYGFLKDDNCKYITSVHDQVMELDSKNPRTEIIYFLK